MLNPQESAIELKKFLKKLQRFLEREANFTLINTKIYDKKKLDDLLCCIEASFPEDYRKYIKKNGSKQLKSNTYYLQLLGAIKNRFWFSTNVYSVRFKEALPLVIGIYNTIDADLRFIFSDQSGMF